MISLLAMMRVPENLEPADLAMVDLRQRMLDDLMAPPRNGTLADDLTDRERVALAIMAGAPYKTWVDGHNLQIATAVPVGFTDRPGGGYLIAIGSMRKDAPC